MIFKIFLKAFKTNLGLWFNRFSNQLNFIDFMKLLNLFGNFQGNEKFKNNFLIQRYLNQFISDPDTDKKSIF